jgi:hypothetical protein
MHIRGQMDPVYTVPLYFLNIYYNIFLSSTSTLQFSEQNFVHISYLMLHAPLIMAYFT